MKPNYILQIMSNYWLKTYSTVFDERKYRQKPGRKDRNRRLSILSTIKSQVAIFPEPYYFFSPHIGCNYIKEWNIVRPRKEESIKMMIIENIFNLLEKISLVVDNSNENLLGQNY